MKISGFCYLILAGLVFCAGVGYANLPVGNANETTSQDAPVTSKWALRPENEWHGRPEYKLNYWEEWTNVKSLNVNFGDISYGYDSDLRIEVSAYTNAYCADLSFDVVVRGYLYIDDDPDDSFISHVPFGRTNEVRRTFRMQWNGPSEAVETVYLKSDSGLTLMLAGNEKPRYVAQIRLVSTDVRWNPEPSKDGYLYGRLPLAFDYAPVLFMMGDVLSVAPIHGASKSGLTEIGEISIRVPMGRRP
jgi:hypothetical protein